eukprot:TRINITY_DN4188_c0_g5_i1.p2 TRINITY_DN4188_c0_g5~~TRINITY_DN4188_c0_g5_i1.p2  ORF type:complete len:108 (+),score=35.77 TRINITY_DN4188_c0_g5_i1:77-400(+)
MSVSAEVIAARRMAKSLYKNLIFSARDYPAGVDVIRVKAKAAFQKNAHVSDPAELEQHYARVQFIIKELEALAKLKKYREMKKRYYGEELVLNFDTSKIEEEAKEAA